MYQSERLLNVPGHYIELIGRRALNVDGHFCRDSADAARLLELIDTLERTPRACQDHPSSRCDHCNELARYLFGLNKRFLCAECYEAEHLEIGGGA